MTVLRLSDLRLAREPFPLARKRFADADVAAGPPPAEVIAYWRAKKLRIGFDYRDIWNEEHDAAFTAAKVMRVDVLEAMREELDRAITDGLTYTDFRANARDRFEKLGWWAPQTVTDPETGEEATVDPPTRLRLIYETNMRTARAVGQLDRIERQAKLRPYLLYQVGPSARHREQHLAWHGLLLPVDDDFWSYAFPPNGWNCKCHVRSVTQREADRLEREGVMAPEPEPEVDDEGNPTGHVVDRRVAVRTKAPELALIPWENKRTGETEYVPEGIDPGFHHRPGEGRAKALAR